MRKAAIDNLISRSNPQESFYDGYVVNAILDATFKSASTKAWEPVILADWGAITLATFRRIGILMTMTTT